MTGGGVQTQRGELIRSSDTMVENTCQSERLQIQTHWAVAAISSYFYRRVVGRFVDRLFVAGGLAHRSCIVRRSQAAANQIKAAMFERRDANLSQRRIHGVISATVWLTLYS